MKLKNKLPKILIIMFLFIMSAASIYASQKEPLEEIINYGIDMLDWESIDKMQYELRDALPEDINFDLRQEMNRIIKGGGTLKIEQVIATLFKLFFNRITIFIGFGARFILIVLLCNLLQTLSSSFQTKNTTKIGFFVCYMVILISVIHSFQIMIDFALNLIEWLNNIMLVSVPTVLAFMATSGFNLSSAAVAPIIITTMSLMTYFIKVIILPCIISVIILEMISSMSEQYKLDKLISMFYNGLKWALRGILFISVGILGLYKFTIPIIDTGIKNATVKFSTAFIPVVGGAVGGAINFVTQGASIVKNAFSAGVIVWIFVIASVPLMNLLAYVITYQLAGAIIEPLGDKKMASIATKLSKGCQFILSSVSIVMLFCICSFIILMTITSTGT